LIIGAKIGEIMGLPEVKLTGIETFGVQEQLPGLWGLPGVIKGLLPAVVIPFGDKCKVQKCSGAAAVILFYVAHFTVKPSH